MKSYWLGVASKEHVLIAVSGGFCQLNHGKEAPLKRMRPGDRIVYYSPQQRMRNGAPIQAFTAIGEVLDGDIRQHVQTELFHPYRRDVAYFYGVDAPIKPLLAQLGLTRDLSSWGQVFMHGTRRLERSDYLLIAQAMQVADPAA